MAALCEEDLSSGWVLCWNLPGIAGKFRGGLVASGLLLGLSCSRHH